MGNPEESYFENNLTDIIGDIRDLVESESPSRDTELLRKCAGTVMKVTGERLSLEAEKIETEGIAPILIFRTGGNSDLRPVLLLAHYDTVHSAGVIRTFPFSQEGGILRGPGVFDMKTGLVQGIWAMKRLIESGEIKRPVELMCTPDEEIGSKSSRATIEKEASGAEYVIVLEASAAGMIKTARKGTGRFSVKVKGRAAHAGLEPEKGINAIQEMSRFILKLQELNGNDQGTTVNVGTIKGGTTANVVPAEATITIDIRVWTPEEASRIEKEIRSLKPENSEAQVEVEGSFDRPPMQSSDRTMELVRKIVGMASEMGREIRYTSVGGASDGNLVAPLGIPVIDGFGAVGANAHSISEYVEAPEIPFRTALLLRTLKEL